MRRVLTKILPALALIGCGNKPAPKPEKDPVPAPSQSAASVVSAAPAPPGIPVFTIQKFPAGDNLEFHPIEGALMVAEKHRVGRIAGESIEWIGKVTDHTFIGDTAITSVVGRFPDLVGAVYISLGRTPMPTFWPLKGKGTIHDAGEGGAYGWIHGFARVGESFLLVSYTQGQSPHIVTVAGPPLLRKLTSDKTAGCKPGEVRKFDEAQEYAAVTPEDLAATPAGTLISVGRLCDTRHAVVEVWEKSSSKSRLIDLDRLWIKGTVTVSLHPGSGDEMFIDGGVMNPVLRYKDGKIEPIPDRGRPPSSLFTSPTGQLHDYDGQTLHRFADGKWTAIGRFAERTSLGRKAFDDKGDLWARKDDGIARVRVSQEVLPALPEEPCKTWFVDLYVVNPKSEPNYTFPTTRKALSTFPEVASLGLYDFGYAYDRRLGVSVASRAQGEAVIAHVKANMKDEDPHLACFEPPKGARKIDIEAKGK